MHVRAGLAVIVLGAIFVLAMASMLQSVIPPQPTIAEIAA